MKKTIYTAFCIVAIAIAGCTKNPIKQYSSVATGTRIKFFHAAPGVPALDAYVNGVQITPTGSVSVTDNSVAASIITGYPFLSLFPGSNYAILPSGNMAIKIVTSTPVPALISAQTVAPATVLSTLSQTTADGDAYSILTSGLPGSVSTPITSFVVKDVFPDAVAGKSYIRLAHLVPNGTAVDITGTYTPTGGTATTVTPISNVNYSNVSNFVAVDVNALSTTSYVFQAYLAGTTTKIGTTTTINLTPGRYYTIIYDGIATDYPVPGTSITLKATKRPVLASDPTSRYPEIYFNPAGLTFYTNK